MQLALENLDAFGDPVAQFWAHEKAVFFLHMLHDHIGQACRVGVCRIFTPIGANDADHAWIVAGIGAQARQIFHADSNGLGAQSGNICFSLAD